MGAAVAKVADGATAGADGERTMAHPSWTPATYHAFTEALDLAAHRMVVLAHRLAICADASAGAEHARQLLEEGWRAAEDELRARYAASPLDFAGPQRRESIRMLSDRALASAGQAMSQRLVAWRGAPPTQKTRLDPTADLTEATGGGRPLRTLS